MDMREANQSTTRLIETIEQHGYMKIVELIDGNHIDEARQLADILAKVGII